MAAANQTIALLAVSLAWVACGGAGAGASHPASASTCSQPVSIVRMPDLPEPMPIGRDPRFVGSVADKLVVLWSTEQTVVGALYDPATNQWLRVPDVSAPSFGPVDDIGFDWNVHYLPLASRLLLLWQDAARGPGLHGAVLDVTQNRWQPMNRSDGPFRLGTTVEAVGDRALMWWQGDSQSGGLTDWAAGLLFDALANRWIPIPAAGAPSPRDGPARAVVGDRLLLWGGYSITAGQHVGLADGAMFDAAQGRWLALPPAPLSARALAWAGGHEREAIVLGGQSVTSAGARSTPPPAGPSGAAFDMHSGQWRPLAEPAPGTPLAGALFAKRDWWSTGRYVAGEATRGSFGIHDIAANLWRSAPAPAPLPNAAQVVFDDSHLLLVGSQGPRDQPQLLPLLYDLTRGSWCALEASSPMPLVPPGRFAYLGAFATGRRVVLWGLAVTPPENECPAGAPCAQEARRFERKGVVLSL